MGGRRRWRIQILCYRAAADPQIARTRAQRPFLNPVQAMNLVDLIRCEHRPILFITGDDAPNQNDVLFKIRPKHPEIVQVVEK
jgi:hypothetical protein